MWGLLLKKVIKNFKMVQESMKLRLCVTTLDTRPEGQLYLLGSQYIVVRLDQVKPCLSLLWLIEINDRKLNKSEICH